jgi:hypothetical protein
MASEVLTCRESTRSAAHRRAVQSLVRAEFPMVHQ